ncbi:EI24 domain-containing protein [Jhaorihella thermophila]|uniref:Uncharacterized protein involved in cysteine biosynthesis n=1 Tax=Jhaorihella thermophila TaxID=488547 RepID=A0A1H5T6N1_9RHOB|nr:EI24 domain-containing protein [Jhaorihella thermophila]SEF57818.1 Uncharacterized protein involved in cysteine biosynthesis [Jhaorihella thermophila]
MILRAFLLSLGQFGDPRFRRVLFLGVGLTVGLLVAVTVAFVWLVGVLVGDAVTLPLIGEVTWLNDALGYSSVALMLALSVFLMVPVASAFISLFLDEVAQAVEDRHYPGLPPARAVSIPEAIRDGLAFLGVLIVANLAALILYLIFTPLAPFIFWGLNGYLLGREYFTLAAIRRLGAEDAARLRAENALTIWMAGTLMAVPLTIPLLNLLVPILGAATFTHIYHALSNRR